MEETEFSDENNPIALKIKEILPYLTKSEAKIARYLLLNQAQMGFETGASVAKKTRVSEITVSRFLKRLGYKGITGLRHDLRSAEAEALLNPTSLGQRFDENSYGAFLKNEAESLLALAEQIDTEVWNEMVQTLNQADRVFVTGFQTVSGIAKDFAQRMSIVRGNVSFFSANEGGLLEWVDENQSTYSNDALVVVDIVPYAREAVKTCELAKKSGLSVIVLTDEFNNWAYEFSDSVFHSRTKTGLLLETTAPIVSMQNLIIHAVAEKNPNRTSQRLKKWQDYLGKLKLYFT